MKGCSTVKSRRKSEGKYQTCCFKNMLTSKCIQMLSKKCGSKSYEQLFVWWLSNRVQKGTAYPIWQLYLKTHISVVINVLLYNHQPPRGVKYARNKGAQRCRKIGSNLTTYDNSLKIDSVVCVRMTLVRWIIIYRRKSRWFILKWTMAVRPYNLVGERNSRTFALIS